MYHYGSKRFVTAALATVLMVGIPGSALAAPGEQVIITNATTTPAMPAPAPMPARETPKPKITEEQALDAVREFFSLPEKRPNFDYRANLTKEGTKLIYRIDATYREGNSTTGFSLGAVDAMTGRILQYSGWQMLPQPIRTGPLTNVESREDAKARAEALLKRVVPDRFASLKEGGPWQAAYYYGGNANQGDIYQFVFTEYVNGIPFPSSSVTVGVHKQTLAYMNLNVGLQEGLSFQPGPAKVTPEEALKVYQAAVTPKLGYHTKTVGFPYGYSIPGEVKLLYSIDNLWRAVDAMTGDWADEPNYYPGPPTPETPPPAPEAVPAGNVKPVKAAALPLTQNTAREFAAEILGVSAIDLRDDDYGYSDEQLYRFSVYQENNSASIHLDRKTGLIRNAWRSSSMEFSSAAPAEVSTKAEPEPAVTPEIEEKAKHAAITLVQTYFSDLRDQLLLTYDPFWRENPEQPDRRFRFTRQVNGLEVPNDAIYISIDLRSMQWREISSNLTMGVTFPAPAGVISSEAARGAALAGREPILIYYPVYPDMTKVGPHYGPMPQPTEARLVYVLRAEPFSGLIDAQTGKPSGLGSPDSLDAALDKVEGHWAEGEFQHFLSRGAITPDRLAPEGPLTRSIAVALLLGRSAQFNHYPFGNGNVPYTDIEEHESYGAVRTAWNQGWLSPVGGETAFRPDAPVTRAEFAVWAVRALGYGTLARAESLVVRDAYQDMADLTVEQRNAVNFLSALGLVGPADGFRGTEAMTQAEGVAVAARIFNYLLTSK